MDPNETPGDYKKRRNRERQVDYRRRKAETRAAELAAAAAAQKVQDMAAARGRGRGRGRGGGRAGVGGRQAAMTTPALKNDVAAAGTDDGFGNPTGTAAMEVDNPDTSTSTTSSTQATADPASQRAMTDPDQPFPNWDATPSRAPISQVSTAAAAGSSASRPPRYGTDFGTAGRCGGGPSAEDMLVSFLAVPEQLPSWKTADVAQKRQMLAPLQKPMRDLGMAERTTDSLMEKVSCMSTLSQHLPY